MAKVPRVNKSQIQFASITQVHVILSEKSNNDRSNPKTLNGARSNFRLTKSLNASRAAVVAASVILVLGLFVAPSLSAAAFSTQNNPSATEFSASVLDCSSAILAKSSAIDVQSAINLAESSNTYSGMTGSGLLVTYSNLMNQWSYDTNCNVLLTNVNVVFKLSNSTGFVGWLVITETPSISQIVSSNTQYTAKMHAGSTGPSANWAGWEFQGNSGGTATIYESEIDYTEPTPTTPPTGCANYHTCDVAVWAGLEDTEGATNSHLAQDGSWDKIQCNPSCVTTYRAFYETLGTGGSGGPQFCTISGQTGGDSMHVTVTNEAANGGSNTKYDYLVNDNTRLKSCSWTGLSYSSMTTPKWSVHILEWPTDCGIVDCSSLAEFSSITIYGSILIGGVLYGVHYPYSNGWYFHDDPMENYCNNVLTTDVSTGSVNSNSGWTATWSSSCGT